MIRNPIAVRLAAAAMFAALAGCGGAGSDTPAGGPTTVAAPSSVPVATPAAAPAAAPSPTPAPVAASPVPTGDPVRGKALWSDLPNTTLACMDCHGEPDLNVNNVLRGAAGWQVIASAIQNDRGGMGALAGRINGFDMQDLSAYLANPGI
jgi:hypothetical protein